MALPRNVTRMLAAVLVVSATVFAASLRRSSPTAGDVGDEALLEAVRTHARDRLVTVRAPVVRILPDDREGSPHQRFLLRIGESVTVLVAHNLDLAERVPVSVGDTVEVSGEYVWTAKGGTLHWTHLDPARHHPPGYIELNGRKYQ